jgi:hypothetical protein
MHELCDKKKKHNANTQLFGHECMIKKNQKNPQLTHNNKVVGGSQNTEGI